MAALIAAIRYQEALDQFARESLSAQMAPAELRGMFMSEDVRENLRNLRLAAIKEYAAALLADEQQQVREALKDWGFSQKDIEDTVRQWR